MALKGGIIHVLPNDGAADGISSCDHHDIAHENEGDVEGEGVLVKQLGEHRRQKLQSEILQFADFAEMLERYRSNMESLEKKRISARKQVRV